MLKLTDQQQEIINHRAGRAVVFAVAGSGKTSTIVRRIGELVNKHCHRPDRILATTFGREAKRQLKDKLVLQLSSDIRNWGLLNKARPVAAQWI
jgi:DNA helicase II / ATP-dependent DNA helicase PcrA